MVGLSAVDLRQAQPWWLLPAELETRPFLAELLVPALSPRTV